MAHEDLNQLLHALVQMAQHLLPKQGEFLPFAATISSDGKVDYAGAYTGEEFPGAQPLLEMLRAVLRQSAADQTIRAAGICYDGLTIPPGQSEKTDSICCSLEHRNGESVSVFVPYRKDRAGQFIYGEIFASHRTPEFFLPVG
jgi:hypothetical protein